MSNLVFSRHGVRLAICGFAGWYGFTSLREFQRTRHSELLQRAQFGSPSIFGQELIAISVTFLFCWTLVTWLSIFIARGGTLIVISIIDLSASVIFCAGLALQNTFLPSSLTACPHLNQRSIFEILVEIEQSPMTPYDYCTDMVKRWRFGVGLVVVTWLCATSNMLKAIGELDTKVCYWRFIERRTPITACWCVFFFPLMVIELLLEGLWNAMPSKLRVMVRRRRRLKAKTRSYRQVDASLRKLLAPELKDIPPIPSLRLGSLRSTTTTVQGNKEKSFPEDAGVVLHTIQTKKPASGVVNLTNDLFRDNVVSLGDAKDNSTPPHLLRMPYDLIVNDLLPYLHQADVLNLLLTSRSTYHALCPRAVADRSADRQTLYRATCGSHCSPDNNNSNNDDDDTSSQAQPRPPPQQDNPTVSVCYSCATRICPDCIHDRPAGNLTLVPRSRSCHPICPPCFSKLIRTPTTYSERCKVRYCTCTKDQNTVAIGSTFPGPFTPSCFPEHYTSREVRVFCSNCAKLSVGQLLKTRLRRLKKPDEKPWLSLDDNDHSNNKKKTCNDDDDNGGDYDDNDDNDDRVKYDCIHCRQAMTVPSGKLAVVLHVCQDCGMECRFQGHDREIVEDALLREIVRVEERNRNARAGVGTTNASDVVAGAGTDDTTTPAAIGTSAKATPNGRDTATPDISSGPV